jgi:HSP20 family molecular chaperone IbpA
MSHPTDTVDVFTPLRQAVSRFIDDGPVNTDWLVMLGRSIPVDIIDTPDEYIIEASLLGVNPEHVHISSAENTVTIRVGRRAATHFDGDVTYLRRERMERSEPEMSRTITLPVRINPEKVSADFGHGVLTIHVVKNDEAKSHAIPLHVTKEAVKR